jgi:hypothetical protein
MYPINLTTDNLNILFPIDKNYNPYIGWVDATVFFRLNGKMQKRRFLVISKTSAVNDYNAFLQTKNTSNLSQHQIDEQQSWLLCQTKDFNKFQNSKKIFIRHVYDVPEAGDSIHQDSKYVNSLTDDGQKPYASEVLVPQKSVDIQTLKEATRYYLKNCFGSLAKINTINFIQRIKSKDIKHEWTEYKKQRDRINALRKIGVKPNILFKENAAKYLFGDHVKEFKIEGSKRTVTFQDGSSKTEVRRNFKIIEPNNPNVDRKGVKDGRKNARIK